MKTHKFARKPFYVDAVRISEENMEEVAQWCKGEIQVDPQEGRHIKVRVLRPMNERQTTAFVGDWILDGGTGFKVYTAKAFDKSFEKVKTLSKAQADEAGIKVPHEPSRKPNSFRPNRPKKPANPVLSAEQAEKFSQGSEPKETKVDSSTIQVNAQAPEKDEAQKLIDEVLRQRR